MKKIIKYIIADILRSKIIIGYAVLLLMISLTVFNLQPSSGKGLLSLISIVLIIVPLISIIFSTIYIYNSREFIELMVSQPIKRKTIWLSFYMGISAAMSLAFVIGVGLPVMIYSCNAIGILLIIVGVLQTLTFISIAMLAAVYSKDKARGIGIGVLIWLYFSLIFDGFVLFLLFQFQDYQIDKLALILTGLNPIDISRILLLLKMDASALMGYTGAVFRASMGGQAGILTGIVDLLAWIGIPLWLSLRKFGKKDL
ncbi:Cu-processing system permease protein [Arachidicoccus rhizosphaerae]|uniref:Cu-processing system permease protein n=1 Tax=Arachidicoccus rhizosphaerae TaxID=551991 RepID=A0A1H4BAJ9_9BACT|nr:ABC transporter permease subunit [Arachidicoccus rhizosphaerae]SEA45084.1 Cu-processing system permease protein [Arachidicoccus rhizosphaerae]